MTIRKIIRRTSLIVGVISLLTVFTTFLMDVWSPGPADLTHKVASTAGAVGLLATIGFTATQ